MPAVELRGITKRFPGVVANHDVNVTVSPSEVHAIVGENGAGKSTLMKILYGMLRPDEGTISVAGREVHFRSPSDAIDVGIGMVHQHFMLADNLTVLENVVLGNEPARGGLIDFGQARDRIREISDRYGLGVRPDVLVERLGVGDRQRVEILKVLYRGARILILDEPTAVLVPQEVAELFRSLGELRREGVTIIFISHKLDEVLSVADTITVIRRGTTVATVRPAEVTARKLAELMVGSELPQPERPSTAPRKDVALELRDVTLVDDGRPVLDSIDLSVHRGEIVGIAGVEGNGQAELVEAIIGLRQLTSGSIRLGDRDVTRLPTHERREAGVGYIPEDRHRHGLLLPATLWQNRVLGYQRRLTKLGGLLLDRRRAREEAADIIADYDVRTPGIDVPAFALSGGNQQKFIVGREMKGEPIVLIAAHPTRGVDVGAQAAIWRHVREARERGLAVLLISADLEELIGMSDTLHVILRGRLVAELDPRTATPEQLGSYMTGAALEGEPR
jgi:simple sugar transport system ATP-binding protein